MKVIYIAGAFRGPTPWDVEQNVRRAEEAALAVWQLGAAAICPHANTRHFDKAPLTSDELFLDGDMEILRRCDAVLVVGDWTLSSGTISEINEAHRIGLPVFHSLTSLDADFLQP